MRHYYDTMVANSPAWVNDKVSITDIESEFAVLMILLFTSGMTEVFLTMIAAVPEDHPLIKLLSIWPKRIAAACEAVDAMSHVKKLVESNPRKMSRKPSAMKRKSSHKLPI